MTQEDTNVAEKAVEQTPEEVLKSMHLARRHENIRKLFGKGREKMLDNKRSIIESKQITTASFHEFVFELQEAFLDGYQLQWKGSGFPSTMGYLFMATVVKLADLPEELRAAEPISEEKKEFLERFGNQAGKAVEEAVASTPKKPAGRPKKEVS